MVLLLFRLICGCSVKLFGKKSQHFKVFIKGHDCDSHEKGKEYKAKRLTLIKQSVKTGEKHG